MSALTLLLTENFADWECALLSAMARTHLGCGLTIATPDGLPVTSMGGLRVTPHADIREIRVRDIDAILLAGGPAWESASRPDVSGLLRDASRAGKVIGAICGATTALARAGILDDRRHTSNDRKTLEATGYSGGTHYVDLPAACRDQTIITAPGTAPLTFAVEVLRAIGRDSAELAGFLALFGRESAFLTPTLPGELP